LTGPFAGGLGTNGPAFSFVYLRADRRGCLGLGLGTGSLPAMTAAHEMIHGFVLPGALTAAPNMCPGDAAHVCDDPRDILQPRPTVDSLVRSLLDSGRDDYYGLSRLGADVRKSPWLSQLDRPQFPLAVVTNGAGRVASDLPAISCPGVCDLRYEAGTVVTLTATPSEGSGFVRWEGACTG